LFSFFLSWLSWYCFHIVQLIRFIRTCPYPAYHIALHVRDMICVRDLYAPCCRLCKRQKLAHMMSWYTHACLLPCIILLFFFFIIAITFLFLFLTYEHAESVFRWLVFNVFVFFFFFFCQFYIVTVYSFVCFLSSFLLLLLCVFIYTVVVPSSESFIRYKLLNVLNRISFTVSIW